MTSCRPNFYKYPGQFNACPAFVYLNSNKKVTTIIGERDSVPAHVYNELTVAWKIDECLTDVEIEELLEQIESHIDVILDNSEIGLNSNNVLTRIMNDQAQAAKEKIGDICLCFFTSETDVCGDDDCDYCNQ